MDNQYLIDALKVISYVTNIPKHKKDDIEFLCASLSMARVYAEVALEHDKEIRRSNRHSTGDDHTAPGWSVENMDRRRK